MNGDRKGKKDDNGIGTAIDFMLSNAKLVLGVGGAAMLGIATLAVKRVSERRLVSPLHSHGCSYFSIPTDVLMSLLLCRCMTEP